MRGACRWPQNCSPSSHTSHKHDAFLGCSLLHEKEVSLHFKVTATNPMQLIFPPLVCAASAQTQSLTTAADWHRFAVVWTLDYIAWERDGWETYR